MALTRFEGVQQLELGDRFTRLGKMTIKNDSKIFWSMYIYNRVDFYKIKLIVKKTQTFNFLASTILLILFIII